MSTKRAGIAVVLSIAMTVLVSGAGAAQRYVELLSIGPDGGNGPSDPFLLTFSDDGSRMFFQTDEALVSADTDSGTDIYERAAGQTTLVSMGPNGGNGGQQASGNLVTPDGSRFYFATTESLVSADTDTRLDLYERAGGQTTLVSVEPAGDDFSTTQARLGFDGVSDDGSRVFFEKRNPFLPNAPPVYYERSGGQTTRLFADVGTGAGFCGVSADGLHVIIRTYKALDPTDTDTGGPPGLGAEDVYERVGGVVRLVSTGPAGTNSSASATCQPGNLVTPDGSRIFFQSDEGLVSSDTDGGTDIYERWGGTTTTLVSTGPDDTNTPSSYPGFQISDDGTRVFFETYTSLLSSDTDTAEDVYERSGGLTTLLTPGTSTDAGLWGVSDDGTRVFFLTSESLVAADTDGFLDGYERFGGQTRLVTAGPAGGNGAFSLVIGYYPADGTRGVPPNGSGALFMTDESLVAGDTDSQLDVYEYQGGQTRLLSIGATGGNSNDCAGTGCPAELVGATRDGGVVFLDTREALVSADGDAQVDIYAATPVPPEGTTAPSVPPGGTASTGGAPSAADPVETSVTTPLGGSVTITESEASGTPPAGYELLGTQVGITVLPGGTFLLPLTLVFRLDGSILAAAGVDHTAVQILKNGIPVGACPGSTIAVPDPCVSLRSTLAGGGAEITIRTSTASIWNFARKIGSVDSTPPTATPTVSGTPGSNGWYVSDVTVTWNWADNAGGSGIDSNDCTTSSTSTGEGDSITVNATCKDLAGSIGNASYTVEVDKTAPTVSVTGVTQSQYLLGAGPTPGCRSSDLGGSRIATAATVAVTTTGTNGVGSFTATCSGAVDFAGNNKAAVSVSYSVVYGFGGFGSPLPKRTLAKSGATISIKFGLTNATGQPISASLAAALAAAGNVKVTLAGPMISPQLTVCGWDAVNRFFKCNIKTPEGLLTGINNPYTITASENIGEGFVTVPAVGSAVNPETIYFK